MCTLQYMFAILVVIHLLANTMNADWIEDITEQSILIGKSASLPCNVTPRMLDDSVLLIFWYRNEAAKPIYTVDARATSLERASHSHDSELNARVTFLITFPIAYFRLNPVRQADTGEYRCRVDFKRGRTRNTIIKLNLTSKT
ncbi:Immunoglobulin domain containing protein 4-like protein [Leptotrombidium deliense]|uniref:Immunoglobulin domain containing protein 4-like protein n=1 Tax=Leptotrombidium deliense TaxID=299467 RepID=A0A443SHC4_9ACAR|nr:Immunoglobulin domain containing protein 4-like protein [Leptotrombidium deliense]